MRVDKDDRYISEQPNKDSTHSFRLLSFLQDLPKKKLIILGSAIIILLVLSLIIFHSSRKKEVTPLTPPVVNGVTSAEENNNTITDEQNSVGISGNQPKSTELVTDTSDSTLNKFNTQQQQLESFSDSSDDLNLSIDDSNVDSKANHHSTTTSSSAKANKTNTKKNTHNSVNRKTENNDLGKNIKIKNDHYVIQLSASKSLEGLKKFVKQNDITDYHIYETKHKSGSLFILIKGNYSSVGEAHKAIKSLPSALQKDKPWVKSGATINKEKVAK
jgi:DamX protein